MQGYDKVFLTPGEAVEAVRIDIAGYGPQPELYARLLPLLPGGGTAKTAVGVADRHRVLALLGATKPEPGEFLARICAEVFDTRCEPGHDEDGEAGVWIDTGMEGFACTRCGRCCLALDFHRECTAEDVAVWREQGRGDILAWVHEESGPDGESVFRIWKNPTTGFYAEACPWLRRISGDRSFVCAIQDVKPAICLSYPGLRKHGMMTGCRGFGAQGWP